MYFNRKKRRLSRLLPLDEKYVPKPFMGVIEHFGTPL